MVGGRTDSGWTDSIGALERALRLDTGGRRGNAWVVGTAPVEPALDAAVVGRCRLTL
jgi:hypothetical protein